MKFRVQLVVCTEEGQAETQYEVAVLDKDSQQIEQLGLTLAEAKQLLKQLQQHVVEHQAAAFLTRRAQCPACGTPFRVKEQTTRSVRKVTSCARSLGCGEHSQSLSCEQHGE